MGVYNARQLRPFKPREGTKLAMDELACLEKVEGEEEVSVEDEVESMD